MGLWSCFFFLLCVVDFGYVNECPSSSEERDSVGGEEVPQSVVGGVRGVDPCRDRWPIYVLTLFFFINNHVSDKAHCLQYCHCTKLFLWVLFLFMLCYAVLYVLCYVCYAMLHYHTVSCSPVWPRIAHTLNFLIPNIPIDPTQSLVYASPAFCTWTIFSTLLLVFMFQIQILFVRLE